MLGAQGAASFGAILPRNTQGELSRVPLRTGSCEAEGRGWGLGRHAQAPAAETPAYLGWPRPGSCRSPACCAGQVC